MHARVHVGLRQRSYVVRLPLRRVTNDGERQARAVLPISRLLTNMNVPYVLR